MDFPLFTIAFRSEIVNGILYVRKLVDNKNTILIVIDLTKEEIVNLNKRLVEEFGGSVGMQNESNLDFVLAKVRNAKDIFRKAAELMHGINKGHPFLDGNKRTALESAKILLMANGVKLKFDQKEVEEFMVKMAQPQYLTLKEVELWIEEHSG